METEPILRMTGISKRFSGVQALSSVNFELKEGEIHALVGANGAGKSTLIKILNGIYRADEGHIEIQGKKADIHHPLDAEKAGISFVHQELNVLLDLSVAENIFVGHLPVKRSGLIDRELMIQKTDELLKKMGVNIEPWIPVRNLRTAERQIVEIIRALSRNARILVMDEPTSSLNETEKDTLFRLLKNSQSQGVSTIFISHFLEDIFEICDRVTVFRDGKLINTHHLKEITKLELISEILGREQPVAQMEQWDEKRIGAVVLKVSHLTKGRAFNDISFELRSGEILGISGLLGAGKTELARSLFGLEPADHGEILVGDVKLEKHNPKIALRNGLGLVTEDRKTEGFVSLMSVAENISLATFAQITNRLGFINKAKRVEIAGKYVSKLQIKTPSIEQLVKNLSGGNQQKVVISKWLATNPKVLLLDEPTRGIDVGAKSEVYKILLDLAKTGVAIIIFSSELDEIIGISDRILVLRGGMITGEYRRNEINKEQLLHALS
jgi:ABC-type sugar transport system ATPase subunit